MKETLIRAARIVVSVGLLYLVLRKAPLGELWAQIQQAQVIWLVAAFGVNSLGNVFGAWRWQLLLRSQSRSISTPYLYGSYMVGLFFNNVLPSSIGGDVFRATGAKKKGGGTLTENLTVVLVERMIGLLATLTLGGVAALTGAAKVLDPRITWALYGALFLSATGLYVALSRDMRALATRILERVPIEFIRRTGGKMIAAFELFSRARGTLIANYLLSLGFQFLLIVHFYLIQFAFGYHLPFTTFVVVVPLVFFVMLVPIGINGLGVRENAFVWLLAPAGMSEASALALSLASYGIAVGQGLLGGAVHLYRESRERGSAAETGHDASLEA